MPELPEVETIKRIIEPQISGKKIKSVEILNERIIAYPKAEIFSALLTDQVIRNMTRRGKFLTIHLGNGDRLILHLRMTGQLLVMPNESPIEKHTHLILHLNAGCQLRYMDVRRFGRFWYLKKSETDDMTGQRKLGIEALDENLTSTYLKEKLGNKKKPIKEMLLDQSIIAGIGNIYADEILHVSGIHPETKCLEITDLEWTVLTEKIPEIIAWGIESNHMTPEEYLEGKGKEYRNTPYLKVYGRAAQPCPNCGTSIEKITIAGRSSCFCPDCQKKRSLYHEEQNTNSLH